MATILVVDDRATNREFLVSLLGYRGHRLIEAADGGEALGVLAGTPVDLVISDILMPTMDGYEMVRRMRQAPATAQVPVIFFTAHYNEREARNLAAACGVSRVLSKPAEAEAVLRAVEDVIASAVPTPTPAMPQPDNFSAEHLRVLNAKLIAMAEELRLQSSHRAALLDMNLQLASELDPAKLLDGFCRSARELIAARFVVVAVRTRDRSTLRHLPISGMDEDTAARVRTALRDREAFADLLTDPRTIRRRIEGDDPATLGLPMEHPRASSLLVAPIRSLSHVYGWACATGKLGLEEFTEEDERLLTIFAAQVGRIYENGSLYADLRRRTEELARESSERQQATHQVQRVFETSQDVILITDGQGVIERASPSATRVLGYALEEIIGQSGAMFIHPDDLESTRREMRAARRGRAIRNFRCRYVHKDGRVVSLVWMATWSGAEHRHYFFGRDMTDYEKTEEQLRQSQKMEAVGQLTGGIAHDFNNILMIVMANAEAIADEGNVDDESRTRVEGIIGAIERAANLTRQLLAFSRKQPLQPRHTNINDLVASTVKLLGRTLGEHIQIETDLADDPWPIHVDRAQLEAALVNLSVNARDAMPGGGRLLVATHNESVDHEIFVGSSEPVSGDFTVLSVADSGTGIAPDILVKVFEPFFTTKEVGKGTGLGLSMVYGFIRQSEGHIRIESEVGQGTSIRLYLPRAQGGPEQASGSPGIQAARAGERIFVVEDNPLVRNAIVKQLLGLGYTVQDAADGATALAAFEAADPPIDLLLTDLIMPGRIDGAALASEVRRRWPRTRIIFMSGYERPVIDNGDLDPDMILLRKPFRRRDLAQAVRQALEGNEPIS